MNWLLLAIIGILLFYAWRGKKRGFIKTVFKVFSTIIAIAITLWISPYISKWVYSNDELMKRVSEMVGGFTGAESINTRPEEVAYIGGLQVPSLIKEILMENNTSDIYSALSVNSFEGYMNHLLSALLVNIGIFLLVCIIVKIILYIISMVLNLISSLPLLNGLNKVAGLLAGFVQGFIVVWILFIVITLFGNYEIPKYLLTLINDSEILSQIYNNNVILIVLTDISKTLF